jgi:hypothetical protein
MKRNVLYGLLVLSLSWCLGSFSTQINIYDNYIVPGSTGSGDFIISNQYNPIQICKNKECSDKMVIIYGQPQSLFAWGNIFVKIPDGADYVFQGSGINEFYTSINVSTAGIWNVSIQPRSAIPAGVTPVAMQ